MGNVIAVLLISLIGYMVAVAVLRAISRLYWRVVSYTETALKWTIVKLSSTIKSTIKEKPEPTTPSKGKRTIKQMLVRAMIILSIWVYH